MAKVEKEEKKITRTAKPVEKSTPKPPDEIDIEAGSESENEEETEETPDRISSKNDEEEESETTNETEDYLQQYQYKKVNDVPTIGGPGTNPDAGSKAERMKQSLLTQRRVSILIPLEPGSDPKVPSSVCLNGYRLDFPTNTYVEVPEQMAKVIMNSQSQTVAALNQNRIDGNSKKEDALRG